MTKSAGLERSSGQPLAHTVDNRAFVAFSSHRPAFAMITPPDPGLVAWTEYLSLVLTVVAAIAALIQGGRALRWKANLLKKTVQLG